MKTLFHIEKEFHNLTEILLESGGEITPEIESALEINKNDLEHKAQNYAFIIKSLIGDCEIIDSEIERLKALKASRIKAQEYLKQKISAAMDLFEITKIESPLIKLSFRSSESIEIIDESLLSHEFMSAKTTITPNKTTIKEAIKSGKIISGAILKTNKNLQIK